jgi:ATP-dependent DNA helicase HFM1/MER3
MRNPFLFEKSLDDRVPDIINRYSAGKQTLIFCASKNGCENLSQSLSKKLTRHGGHVPRSVINNIQDPKLRALVAEGHGYHHAGLPCDDRTIVENLYLQGVIHTLCTTSTLAYGVNLPAYLVIIKGTNQWRGGNRGYERMLKSTMLQMMGRAGRPGFDTSGVAVVMTSENHVSHYRDLNLEVIESTLPAIFAEGT